MTTRRAPCPKCDRGPRDTALSVTTDERGTVAHCFRCGYVEANNRQSREPLPVIPKASGLRWSATAEAIWQRTEPLRGSLAARYLEGRRCLLPLEDGDLRFLQPTDRHPAAMVARITDALTCEPLSLHFTRLAPDGSKLDRRLLAGHVKRGGVIRLWPDDAVTHGLAIAEGIESALSAAHLYAPAWSTIDAGNLAGFPVLAGIECLSIFADQDAAGLTAARECARRWRDAGRDVRILAAETGDANDVIRGAA